ncbi:mastermind-like protein 2 isoform X2 [Ambystoma mexicanum]|uniref:mastermind-like protein 2 isoform X2 n=1 Tax=Ambystoma mexicanum TaxID=8296 RepID=UPI0037E786C3
MGDTAPQHPPTGSLGVGGPGAGLLGGGTITPRVHIVERLRARIAICRQHHLTCEGRYERNRAETTDRERENTLQLLNLVQHGGSGRKSSKHSKASAGPPPDYHHHHQQPHLLNTDRNGNGIAGEPQPPTSASGDPRSSTLIALQGSLKRKLVVNPSQGNIKRQNGLSGSDFLDSKRMLANDKLSVGPGGNHVNNGQSQPASAMMANGPGLHRKSNNVTSSDMFNLTLKDIKKEPDDSMSCGKHLDCQMSSENMFTGRYGDDFAEHLMDPDLQELFNELTDMSVPPMSDLELQNMINITIKQDEPFNIDLGQQNQSGSPKPCLPMEKIVIKTEYSPSPIQVPLGSPQIRSSSEGPAFSMSSVAMSTSSPVTSVPLSQAQSQVSSCSSRTLPTWQEVSHAQQLKQIAANRQQNALIQLQQQHQQNQSSNWSTLPPSGPSGSFGQEKVPSPALRQPQYSPHTSQMPVVPSNGNQPKGMSNYLYKSNSSPQNNHMNMIMQQKNQDLNLNFINNSHAPVEQHHNSTKALFHFSSEQTNPQMPSVLGSQNKPSIVHYTQHQQPSAAAQQQQQQVPQTLQNQSLSRSPNVPMSLQQKLMLQKMQQSQQVPGLQYSVLQHRQDKITPQDQLNRHLTRPPPDYKDQRRNMVNIQQASQYSGGSLALNLNSNQPVPNPVSTSSLLSQNSNLLSTSHSPKMAPLPGVRNMGIYSNISCNQPSLYTVNSGNNQMQQHTNQNQMGTNQTNSMVGRQSALGQGNGLPSFGTGFGVTSQQVKQNVNHGATNMAGQRATNVMINSNSTQQSWASQEAVAKLDPLQSSAIRFPTSTSFGNQSLQPSVGNQHFSQRAMAPPNQIAPGVQMRPVSQLSPASNGQTMGSLRAGTIRPNHLRSQALPNINTSGPSVNPSSAVPSTGFTTTNHTSRAFPSIDNGSDLAFDFLNQQNDSLGSALNSHSDYIDSLLKTGPGNDDWMKDINLDEILGNPT